MCPNDATPTSQQAEVHASGEEPRAGPFTRGVTGQRGVCSLQAESPAPLGNQRCITDPGAQEPRAGLALKSLKKRHAGPRLVAQWLERRPAA